MLAGSEEDEEDELFDDWEAQDIVCVSAEVAPWSKTGGLGDVMGALPRALAARGHRVMVVTPRWVASCLCGRVSEEVDGGRGLGGLGRLAGGPRGAEG